MHVVTPEPPDTSLYPWPNEASNRTWIRYANVDLFARPPGPKRILRALRSFRNRRTVQKLALDDWTIVNGWSSVRYWQSLAEQTGKRTAIVVRESPRHFRGPDRDGPHSLNKMISCLAGFERLIFVSARQQLEWCSFDALAGKPSFLLPNCCEEEEVSAILDSQKRSIRESLDIPESAFLIVLVGTLEQRKGHDTLLAALEQINKGYIDAHVLLLGNAGTEWGQQLLHSVNSSALAAQVTHVGAQSSALEYLHSADVVVAPSRAEALPRSILEAMCLGKTVIGSDVDGIPELIVDGESGFLFPAGDATALADRLLRVRADPVLAKQLGENGRKRYLSEFSRAKQFGKMRDLHAWLG